MTMPFSEALTSAASVVVSPVCVWISGRSPGRTSPSFNPAGAAAAEAEVVAVAAAAAGGADSAAGAAAAAAFLDAAEAAFFSVVRFFLAAGAACSTLVTAGDSLLAALRVERRRTGAADITGCLLRDGQVYGVDLDVWLDVWCAGIRGGGRRVRGRGLVWVRSKATA